MKPICSPSRINGVAMTALKPTEDSSLAIDELRVCEHIRESHGASLDCDFTDRVAVMACRRDLR